MLKGNVKKQVRVLLALILCMAQVFSFFAVAPAVNAAGGLSFDDEGEFIRVTNSYYEFAFNKSNGGIAYIQDMATGERVSEGGNGGYLWYAAADPEWVGSTFGNLSFSYDWDPDADEQLKLYWAPNGKNLNVEVSVYFSEDRWVKMTAQVQNDLDRTINRFGFPVELKVKANSINDALLPMMPGAKLNSKFFKDNKSYTAVYPGEMFADYVAVNSANGKLAIYSEKQTAEVSGSPVTKVQPAYIGFEPSTQDPTCTTIFHDYKVSVNDGSTWQSPGVVITVGADYQDTIAGYKYSQGIDGYKSLSAKLGSKAQQYYESPMYKLDVAVEHKTFDSMKTNIIDKIRYPGLVHPVAFQNNGHDNNYPDFIPPAEEWGTADDFASLVAYAKSKGNLVMPYTNFSWWDNQSPTLSGKSDDELRQYVATDGDGSLNREDYGPNSGYVMDLNNSFVKDKITEQHNALMNTIGMDGIFEDQWGARAAPFDFNTAGINAAFDASTSYFEGVLGHAKAHAGNNLMTECGTDVLANDEVGFMGTNYLWDIAGYRSATSSYTEYYPMAGMLFRDKVLLYQHDLAGETWTDDKNMFRWNIAQGYNFSGSFHVNDVLLMDNAWLDLIGIFQKNVLSKYADKLVTGYDNLGNRATRTTFGSGEYVAYSNWSNLSTFTTPDTNYTLPADGAMVMSADGSVVGGVFSSYNRHSLSSGDHYIVETRAGNEIKVFQPVGEDTDLFINKPEGWTGVSIQAYDYRDQQVGTQAIEAYAYGDNQVRFNYRSSVDQQKVAYYKLIQSESENTPLPESELKPDLVITAVNIDPANAAADQPVNFNMVLMNQGTAAAVPVERTRPTDNVVTTEYGGGFTVDGTWITFTNVPIGYNLATGESITLTSAGTWTVTPGVHRITSGIDDWLNFVVESNEGNNVFEREIEIASNEEPPPPPPEVGPENAVGFTIDIDSDQDINALWSSVVKNEVNKAVVGSSDPNFSGKFGTLWDADNLYLLAEVKDETKRADGAATWQNDSVELYLDMDNLRGGSYGADDFQYRFAWSASEEPAAEENSKNNTAGVRYRCIDTADGYRIIAELPWDTLGKEPSADLNIGFDVAMNDNDTGARATQIIWHSRDDNAYQYPDRFGVCILKERLPVTGITITSSSITLKVGQTAAVSAGIAPAEADIKGILWSSSPSSIATVDANGLVTGVRAGTTTISAVTVDGGYTANCSVTVEENYTGSLPSSPSTAVTPSAPTSSQLEIKPVLSGSDKTAKASINSGDLKKAIDAVAAAGNGDGTVTINAAKVEGADRYAIELPKEALTSDTAGRNIRINTAAGTIIAPGNMFNAEEVKQDNLQLVIGVADKSTLKEELKASIGDRPVIELKTVIDGKTVEWENPEAPVTVFIDYKPTAEELKNPEHITVWYVDGKGDAVAVPSARYDAATGKVSFTVTHFSNYAVVYVQKTFNDLEKYSWAKTAIEVMTSKGIMDATSENTFSPSQSITREEFVTVLVKTLGLNAKVDENFDDVEKGSSGYQAIGVAKKLGITSGVGGNRFNPKGQITRQDMLVIVAQALKAAGKSLEPGSASDVADYKDAGKVSSYALKAVSSAVKAGLITGTDKMLNPKEYSSRAEIAVIVYKLYKM